MNEGYPSVRTVYVHVFTDTIPEVFSNRDVSTIRMSCYIHGILLPR